MQLCMRFHKNYLGHYWLSYSFIIKKVKKQIVYLVISSSYCIFALALQK